MVDRTPTSLTVLVKSIRTTQCNCSQTILFSAGVFFNQGKKHNP